MDMDMFNLFDDFENMFSRLYSRFNRPCLDQSPYSVYKAAGKGYIIVCNTLGIDKENLSVNIEKEKGRAYPILRIRGKTEMPKINFSNSVDLAIQLKLDSEITDVKYELKNGLTIVYIAVKVEEIPKMEAKYIEDDSSSLEW